MEMTDEMERPVSDVMAGGKTRFDDSLASSDDRPNTTKSRVMATSALSQPRLARTPATSRPIPSDSLEEQPSNALEPQNNVIDRNLSSPHALDVAVHSNVSSDSFLITELRDQDDTREHADNQWKSLELGRRDTSSLSTPLASQPDEDDGDVNDEAEYDTDLDIEGGLSM